MLIHRIYRVKDVCGNSIDITQIINVNDDILPTASNPESITVQCIDDVPVPDTNVVTDEADNCSIPIVEFVSEISDNQNCPETITRTYSITDDCGNSINVTQSIIVIDDIAPTASDPEPINVQCFDEVPQPDINVVTDATDNCSIPTVSFVSDVSDIQTCLETITRTYSVTDDCGNTILVTQEIMIIDETAPEVISPYDEEFYVICGEIPEIPDLEFVDNCSSEVIVEFEETEDYIDEYNYDINRNWTVTDECDNTQEFTQLIYVRRDFDEDEFSISLCVTDDPIDLNDFIVNTPFTDGDWEGNIITSIDNIIDPSITPLGDHIFTYTYTVNECIWTTIVNVNINDNCVDYPCIKSLDDVFISKLVSANNDGINDFFEVNYIIDQSRADFCNIRVNLEFFNRWGVRVYDDINYDNDWDGSYTGGMLGSYDKLPTGTYYYIVNLENSGLDPIQGFILLGTN
jgi:gliding motility-associated-like protein